jgi:TonB-linked SusC/RagA family outer membrane protein
MMKHKRIKTSSGSILFWMAMTAGCGFLPQHVNAAQSLLVEQQTGNIKGTVVDQTGEPIIGATVIIKGTTVGTVTDIDGNFALNGKQGDMLEISFVGYKTQLIKFTQSPLRVKLEDDTQTLNEVVVVGFGTQKKVNLTGSVAMVGGDELAERPVTSAAQALQGMVPGLQISSSSGSMDATSSINVRGTATIGQGTSGDPLILIDGAEGDINTINPQDIESISVLKDAAASSIYGSRAPFGVILITTKRGKSGKAVVNYNNSFRFNSLVRGKHMMNSVDFSSWVNDAYNNMGWGLFFDADRMAQIKEYHEATPVGPGTRKTADGKLVYGISSNNGSTWADGYGYGIDDVDWYDAVYKSTAFAMEHNASISGGTETVDYYASFNYLNNNGFMELADDKFNRYTGTIKLGVKMADWVRMNLNSRWARTDFERPANLTESLYSDMARQGWPVLPLYDRNGYYYSSPSPGLGLATGGNDTKQRDILTQQIGFIFEPIKDWKTHLDFTYRTDNSTRHWGSQMTYNHDVNGDAYVYNQSSNVYEGETKENYYDFQAYTEYTKQLGKHNLHAMIGFQAEQLKQLTFGAQRNGILDSSRPEIDLTSGLSYSGSEIVPSVSGSRNQWQTAGFFGRVNYNFDERYLFEFNIRRDGTSRFRRDNMWKTFPSVSLGWNIAREKFWQGLQDKVNTLKLRASYGSLGNQNTDNWYQTYQTVSYYPSTGSWLQDGKKPNTTYAPSLVSSSLTWERIESYDLGLDFGLLDNRLTGTFDYYIRNTKDMIGNAPELPSILGTSVPVTNNTDLRTSGWEFQLSWRDRLENGFSYGATFNISDSRTKITRYPNNPTGDLSTYIEGRYINEIWGYETVGLARTDAEMNAHLATVDQSTLGDNWAAGDIMYKDLNGDGKISSGSYTIADHGDLKVIGNSTPRYLVGLDLNAAYKGFDLRLFFQGVMKRDFWAGSSWGGKEYLFGTTNSGVWWAAGLTDVQDYFRDENTWSVVNGYRDTNTDAWLPRVLYSDKNLQTQSRYLLNAAYVRLKNMQIGYTLPKSWLQHASIQNVRFFVSMENLFTITDLPNQFDPELLGNDNNNGYPLSKTFSFGVNVTL